VLLSINRFERKKALSLAIEALIQLKSRINSLLFNDLTLVIAGGYDARVKENVDHYVELNNLAIKRGLSTALYPQVAQVVFLRSFSDAQKNELLQNCLCVLYTPSNEHFGIVPLEAMLSNRPVIGVNSGGPCESIVHNETGMLCDPDPGAFADAIHSLIVNPEKRAKLGALGRARVIEKFSLEVFSEHMDQVISSMLCAPSRRLSVLPYFVFAFVFVALLRLIWK